MCFHMDVGAAIDPKYIPYNMIADRQTTLLNLFGGSTREISTTRTIAEHSYSYIFELLHHNTIKLFFNKVFLDSKPLCAVQHFPKVTQRSIMAT